MYLLYIYLRVFFFRFFVILLRCGIFIDFLLMFCWRFNDRDFNFFNNEEECFYIFEDDEIYKVDDVVL